MARTSSQSMPPSPAAARHGDSADAVLNGVADHLLDGEADCGDGGFGSPCSLGAEVEDHTIGGRPDEQVAQIELAPLAQLAVRGEHVRPPLTERDGVPFAHHAGAVAAVGEYRFRSLDRSPCCSSTGMAGVPSGGVGDGVADAALGDEGVDDVQHGDGDVKGLGPADRGGEARGEPAVLIAADALGVDLLAQVGLVPARSLPSPFIRTPRGMDTPSFIDGCWRPLCPRGRPPVRSDVPPVTLSNQVSPTPLLVPGTARHRFRRGRRGPTARSASLSSRLVLSPQLVVAGSCSSATYW